MKSKILFTIGVAGFVVFILFIANLSGLFNKADKEDVKGLLTAQVVLETISEEVLSTGIIKSLDEIDVISEISGRIGRITKEVGDYVKKGELIIKIDKDNISVRIKDLTRDLEKFRLRFESAKADLENSRSLYDQGFIAQREWDDLKVKSDIAKVEYDSVLSKQKDIQSRLKFIDIISPINGVVVEVMHDQGDSIRGILDSTDPAIILRIIDPDKKHIQTKINQVDIVNMKIGQEARIVLDAFPGQFFLGKVTKIAPAAQVVGGRRVFMVDVDIREDNPKLKPGITSKVFIITNTKENALTVPIEAVFDGDEGQAICFLVEHKNKWKEINVATGISTLTKTEITGGLNLGDIVYLEDPRD